jgi:hypothetical protein
MLENEFENGNKAIKVDEQRFVDVNFASPSAVRKEVRADDDDLIGLQRRFVYNIVL